MLPQPDWERETVSKRRCLSPKYTGKVLLSLVRWSKYGKKKKDNAHVGLVVEKWLTINLLNHNGQENKNYLTLSLSKHMFGATGESV